MFFRGDSAIFSQSFGLGIAAIFVISGAIPQQLLAAEPSLDNLTETQHKAGKLAKSLHCTNSSDVVVNMSNLSNLKFGLSESVIPNSNSKNADDSISNNITLPGSNIFYKPAVQLESGINSNQNSTEQQLVAREVDLDTLCQSFPLNSRCANYKSPAESQRQQLLQQLRQAPAKSQLRSGEPSKAGLYGSISGDARFLNETTVEPLEINLNFDTGYGVNAALGYRFRNHLRLEGQFSYGSNDIGEIGLPGIAAVTTTVTNNITTAAVPLTTASPISTPVNITIPGVGTIPAGTTVPAGIALNPGPPLTTASAINVGPVTIPSGTNLSALPGLRTTGGTPETTLPVTTAVTTPEVLPTTVEARGKVTTLSGLLNLYYDFPVSSQFEPYIGAGIGGSRASAENIVATYPGTDTTVRLDGSSTVLVYQLMAGVAYYFNRRTALTLGYRYFNVAKQSFDVEPLGEVEADGLGIHNIELGLRFGF